MARKAGVKKRKTSTVERQQGYGDHPTVDVIPEYVFRTQTGRPAAKPHVLLQGYLLAALGAGTEVLRVDLPVEVLADEIAYDAE